MAMAFGYQLRRHFGPVTLDQLVFHLQMHLGPNVRSLFAVDPRLAQSVLENALLVPATLAIALFLARRLLLERFSSSGAAHNCSLLLSMSILVGSYVTTPLLMGTTDAIANDSMLQHELFAVQYHSPRDVNIDARERRNLVVIYVESMEQSYDDKTAFKKNLIPHLSRLQRDNVHFGRFLQVANTGWTMAGLVSTMCGIPLKALGLFTHNRFDAFDNFLPNAICLPDILRAHGYRTEFLQGAALAFAGKGRFLSQHGFATLFGKEEIEHEGKLLPGDRDNWRIRDDALIGVAKQRLEELAASGQPPFFLALLTSDTHTARDAGHASRYCANRDVASYSSLVECTDELVGEFVKWIQQHDPDRNTAIIVIGDHLAMFGNPRGNEAYEILAQKGDRSPYHVCINCAPRHGHSQSRLFSHYDLFPTMLTAAGFEINGHRLALGVDLFSGVPTLVERYGGTYVNAVGLQQPGPAYLALWGLECRRLLSSWCPSSPEKRDN